MNEIDAVWKRFFGEMWNLVTDSNHRIGGFLLNEEKNQLMLDRNAAEILSIPRDISCNHMLKVLEELKNDMNMHSPIQIYIDENLQKETGYMAGIIRLEKQGEQMLSELFSMSSQTQLVQKMLQTEGKSMLAFVKLEGVPGNFYASRYIQSAMNTVVEELPPDAMIAANNKNLFWIFVPEINGDDMALKFLQKLRKAVEKCIVTDEFGIRIAQHHEMTITAGTAGDSDVPTERMHTANFALYEAIGIGAGSIVHFNRAQYESMNSSYVEMRRFTMLMEENRFQYHFQPIVSVDTGEIVAYEALMRTDESIGMGPLDVLRLAEKTQRLYDVEHATLYNCIEILNEHQAELEGKRLFINAISDYLLTDEDFDNLSQTYGELLNKVVIELTEQTETNDFDLKRIQKRLKENRMQMAIDDYGTGYSNTANLLRYNPVIVKIDRSLISGIDTNQRTRNIVESIIGFLHDSGFVALAEGVETREELQTMIRLGADLIQGYYTAKPRPVFLHEIPDSVRKEIAEARDSFSGEHQKYYHPEPGETIYMDRLQAAKYTGVIMDVECVTITSIEERVIEIPVYVKEGTECDIHLKNARIGSPTEFGSINVGRNCVVHIDLEGDNILNGKGIYVPESSALKMTGEGNLSIAAQKLNCYGIGAPSDDSYGNIEIDIHGTLEIVNNGDTIVGIGGGRVGINSNIRIVSGYVHIVCHGRKCLGIGAFDSNISVSIMNTEVFVEMSTPNSVCVGSFKGNLSLYMRNFLLKLHCTGDSITGVGVESGGHGMLDMADGEFHAVMKGREMVCFGTNGGALNCEGSHIKMRVEFEGDRAIVVGDLTGGGDYTLSDIAFNVDYSVGAFEVTHSEQGSVNCTDVGQKLVNLNA